MTPTFSVPEASTGMKYTADKGKKKKQNEI